MNPVRKQTGLDQTRPVLSVHAGELWEGKPINNIYFLKIIGSLYFTEVGWPLMLAGTNSNLFTPSIITLSNTGPKDFITVMSVTFPSLLM